MAEVTCPGLPASWLNAWLAAVGATVLDSRIRLHWATEKTPVAVLSADGADPVETLADSWPTTDVLAAMPIAEHWSDTPRLPRKVPVDAFIQRARATRGSAYSWTLSSTMTDLHLEKSGEVAHGPFDPPAPKGATMQSRLSRVHDRVEPSVERLKDSFAGRAVRVEGNGLGFDLTRLGSQSDASKTAVDPVIEVLAFYGLALFPVRGEGTDFRLARKSRSSMIQRGWRQVPGGARERRFMWPAWTPALDHAAIDAILDAWKPDKRFWPRLGIHDAWRCVPFAPKADLDATRGFGSERL